jgi:hypothetical protein
LDFVVKEGLKEVQQFGGDNREKRRNGENTGEENYIYSSVEMVATKVAHGYN